MSEKADNQSHLVTRKSTKMAKRNTVTWCEASSIDTHPQKYEWISWFFWFDGIDRIWKLYEFIHTIDV